MLLDFLQFSVLDVLMVKGFQSDVLLHFGCLELNMVAVAAFNSRSNVCSHVALIISSTCGKKQLYAFLDCAGPK